MSETQQFCLRWHNYQTSLLSSLPQLLDWDDLTDVTLSAGGCSIKAHRIVLSACSQYFKSIFKELQPMQHPVIVVPGAEFSDLSALVTFMYNGEVNIYQHQLPSLIALADTLHINGLAHFATGKCDEDVSPVSSPTEDENRWSSSKRVKIDEPLSNHTPLNNNDPCIAPSPNKNMFVRKPRRGVSGGGGGHHRESRTTIALPPIGPEDLSKKHGTDGSSPSTPPGPPPSLQIVKDEVTPPPNKPPSSKLYATCLVCGKQLSNQYNLRVHMETHCNAHYACSSCSHVSRSRDALRKHVSYRHPPQQTHHQQQQPTPTQLQLNKEESPPHPSTPFYQTGIYSSPATAYEEALTRDSGQPVKCQLPAKSQVGDKLS